jgi:hypothetical protein
MGSAEQIPLHTAERFNQTQPWPRQRGGPSTGRAPLCLLSFSAGSGFTISGPTISCRLCRGGIHPWHAVAELYPSSPACQAAIVTCAAAVGRWVGG